MSIIFFPHFLTFKKFQFHIFSLFLTRSEKVQGNSKFFKMFVLQFDFCSFVFQIPCSPLPCHDYHHSPTDPNGRGLRRQLLDLPNERRWYGMPSERHQHQNQPVNVHLLLRSVRPFLLQCLLQTHGKQDHQERLETKPSKNQAQQLVN